MNGAACRNFTQAVRTSEERSVAASTSALRPSARIDLAEGQRVPPPTQWHGDCETSRTLTPTKE
ncbi:MAG: hypothetical protein ACM3Y9_14055, partial [Ignavibacteria bacterium]